jgi:ubiquinone/menaquinone biosynthesis C-methylase UbiE
MSAKATMDEMGAKSQRTYIPAAGLDLFLPFYDLITRVMGADRARAALLGQAEFTAGQRVLDIGCGTGTLAVLLKQRRPQAEIVGLDPDPKALARARRKAQRSAVQVQFNRGFSDALDFPECSFNHVFSSYMFHHLDTATKETTLREIRRVLKPDGYFHLLDFGAADAASAGSLLRWINSHHGLNENSESRILTLIADAGFSDAKMVGSEAVLFGLMQAVYYRAAKRGRS